MVPKSTGAAALINRVGIIENENGILCTGTYTSMYI